MRPWRYVTHKWRRLFRDRNYVYALPDFDHGTPISSDNMQVLRIGGDSIPPTVSQCLVAAHGDRIAHTDRWEMQHGAVLWVVMMNGAYVASCLSRRGDHYLRWLIPVAREDIILFRTQVVTSFRGHGLAGRLMRHVGSAEWEEGGRVLIDTKIYNKASIRSIEKAGFHRIGVFKPVPVSEQFVQKHAFPE